MSDELKNSVKSRGYNPWLFRIIAISLPFIFLVLLEILLRVFSIGTNLDLFQTYNGNSDYLVFNQDASKKYFTDPSFATTGNTEIFKKVKEPNTIRLFVLGESTTIGYPYYHNGSFHRWLQYRLTHTFPDNNFEIINLSLTAVNSYTIKGFAEEVVNYEPDAVLIYVGHNEYYGALGVGSTQSFGGSPSIVNMILELRELRTVQLFSKVYRKTSGLWKSNNKELRTTRMERMVSEQGIRYQSELYQKGIEQFEFNISQSIGLFDLYDIPVFMGNLVSNEKDLAPFVSTAMGENDAKLEFVKNYELAQETIGNYDSLMALTYFERANLVYQGNAQCNYQLGKLNYARGEYEKAKEYFQHAKELDELRFRAPEKINEVILQLCEQFSNLHLADIKSAFEKKSNNQLIGNELLIDHVHPNLTGYSIMSEAFYKALKEENILPSLPEKEISNVNLIKEIPISVVDSLAGAYRIHELKRRWPYNDSTYMNDIKPTCEEQVWAKKLSLNQMSWRAANDSLYTYYMRKGQLDQAAKILEALVLEFPYDPAFYDKTAMLFGELKELDKAVYYFKRSFNLSPSFDKARYLFVIYLQMDQPENSIRFLDYAIEYNSKNLNLQSIKPLVKKIIRLQTVLEKSSSRLEIQNEIAASYVKMNNFDGAAKYIDLVLKNDPTNDKALALFKLLNSSGHGN